MTRVAPLSGAIFYADGEKRYILSPVGLGVNDVINTGEGAEFKPGNAMPLRLMPGGTMIHNIEMVAGGGAKMVRSAGAAAQLMAKEGDYALLRLPSGEMRRVSSDCMATIGGWGTSTIRISSWVRPAENVLWAGARP